MPFLDGHVVVELRDTDNQAVVRMGIVGDDKYGNLDLNKKLQKQGLKRMFLHSSETKLAHPLSHERLRLFAPLPKELDKFIQALTKNS